MTPESPRPGELHRLAAEAQARRLEAIAKVSELASDPQCGGEAGASITDLREAVFRAYSLGCHPESIVYALTMTRSRGLGGGRGASAARRR